MKYYFTRNAKRLNIEILSSNGYADHIHLLIKLNKNSSISEIAKFLKGSSSRWINSNNFFKDVLFRWQRGYYCESVSKENLEKTINYIEFKQIKHFNKYVEEQLEGYEECYRKQYRLT